MVRAEFIGGDETLDAGVAGHLDVRRQLAGSLVVVFAIAAFCGLKVLTPPHQVADKVSAHKFAVIQPPQFAAAPNPRVALALQNESELP
ncbi:MAG TPA: hypothetical protein VGL41_12350 [Roseiarcus sp.]|jgi:hypothetical protein